MSWNFKHLDQCPSSAQLHAQKMPFYGRRLNKSQLKRKISHKEILRAEKAGVAPPPLPDICSWRYGSIYGPYVVYLQKTNLKENYESNRTGFFDPVDHNHPNLPDWLREKPTTTLRPATTTTLRPATTTTLRPATTTTTLRPATTTTLRPVTTTTLRPATTTTTLGPVTTQNVIPSSSISCPFPQDNRIGITRPRDQGGCGSCWSFAISCALADRYAIFNARKSSPVIIHPPLLSPLWLMNQTYQMFANSPGDTCNAGGDPYYACQKYLEVQGNGVKLENCWPYQIIENYAPKQWLNPNPLPNNSCWCGPSTSKSDMLFSINPGSTRSLIGTVNGRIDPIATINEIKTEILQNGPVICGYAVFFDFLGGDQNTDPNNQPNYWSQIAPYPCNKTHEGVYICSNSSKSQSDGGHAVTVTGWGTCKYLKGDDGKPLQYWEVRNSWGSSGDQGYGRVAMSTSARKNIPLEFDVPLQSYGDGEYSGGMIAIVPGPLPIGYADGLKEHFEAMKKPVHKKNTNNYTIKDYIGYLLIIIAIALFVIAIVKIVETNQQSMAIPK